MPIDNCRILRAYQQALQAQAKLASYTCTCTGRWVSWLNTWPLPAIECVAMAHAYLCRATKNDETSSRSTRFRNKPWDHTNRFAWAELQCTCVASTELAKGSRWLCLVNQAETSARGSPKPPILARYMYTCSLATVRVYTCTLQYMQKERLHVSILFVIFSLTICVYRLLNDNKRNHVSIFVCDE